MKNLLLAIPLALCACAGPGNVPINGPVERTIERVLTRTEDYLTSPDPPFAVDAGTSAAIESAIVAARTMTALPEVSGAALLDTMNPVMDLHDLMVTSDQNLEPLESSIYLGDTARLRSLFSAASVSASALVN